MAIQLLIITKIKVNPTMAMGSPAASVTSVTASFVNREVADTAYATLTSQEHIDSLEEFGVSIHVTKLYK